MFIALNASLTPISAQAGTGRALSGGDLEPEASA